MRASSAAAVASSAVAVASSRSRLIPAAVCSVAARRCSTASRAATASDCIASASSRFLSLFFSCASFWPSCSFTRLSCSSRRSAASVSLRIVAAFPSPPPVLFIAGSGAPRALPAAGAALPLGFCRTTCEAAAPSIAAVSSSELLPALRGRSPSPGSGLLRPSGPPPSGASELGLALPPPPSLPTDARSLSLLRRFCDEAAGPRAFFAFSSSYSLR